MLLHKWPPTLVHINQFYATYKLKLKWKNTNQNVRKNNHHSQKKFH